MCSPFYYGGGARLVTPDVVVVVPAGGLVPVPRTVVAVDIPRDMGVRMWFEGL